MTKCYDVLIVGAGISGGTLLYVLSKLGLDVCLIEREDLPRYKPCGGGLTPLARKYLPLDISEIIEDECFTATLEYRTKVLGLKKSERPIVSMVERENLDFFVINHAKELGAKVHSRTRFLDLKGNLRDLLIITDNGNYRCRFLIGADGALSRVALKGRFSPPRIWMWALQGEAYPSSSKEMVDMHGKARFELGFQRSGYSWVFPKKDHLSIGTCTVFDSPSRLRQNLFTYMKALKLDNWRIKRLKLHPIPFGNRYALVQKANTILIGDAFGLTDPITGEGIQYGVRSAILASEVLRDYFAYPEEALTHYYSQIREEFFLDLQSAFRVAKAYYSRPALSRALSLFFGWIFVLKYYEILSGDKRYVDLLDSFPFNTFFKRGESHEGPGN